ncbi:hypothetical protein BpHYR1_001020 [Brachionus plicatilis]|uniref:Uncharacterized protein n=1 Tax=Brachionus plicatilis TaxID=10195 RepID=A0A3M7T8F6_BRAPC|nr:hypothetical protein BpHYR1_001020 [Brachionus plicatilis]
MKIPDRKPKKGARTMNPISLSVMLKSMEMIYIIAENDFQNSVEQICDVPSVSNKILEQDKFDMFLNYEFDLDRVQKLKTIVSEYDVLNIDLFLNGIIGLLDDQLSQK